MNFYKSVNKMKNKNKQTDDFRELEKDCELLTNVHHDSRLGAKDWQLRFCRLQGLDVGFYSCIGY